MSRLDTKESNKFKIKWYNYNGLFKGLDPIRVES